MEAHQRQIQAMATIDGIPADSRMSSSNPYKKQANVNNIRFNNDHRRSLHLVTSTPDDDNRYHAYSDEPPLPRSFEEDISPSSSIIDAMEELFIDYGQSETRNNTANPKYDQLTRSSVMRDCDIRAHHPEEAGGKISKGVTLTEPFGFIWRMPFLLSCSSVMYKH